MGNPQSPMGAHPFHEEISADSNHPGEKIPSLLLPRSCGEEEEEGGITWNLLLLDLGGLFQPQPLWDSPDQVPQR